MPVHFKYFILYVTFFKIEKYFSTENWVRLIISLLDSSAEQYIAKQQLNFKCWCVCRSLYRNGWKNKKNRSLKEWMDSKPRYLYSGFGSFTVTGGCLSYCCTLLIHNGSCNSPASPNVGNYRVDPSSQHICNDWLLVGQRRTPPNRHISCCYSESWCLNGLGCQDADSSMGSLRQQLFHYTVIVLLALVGITCSEKHGNINNNLVWWHCYCVAPLKLINDIVYWYLIFIHSVKPVSEIKRTSRVVHRGWCKSYKIHW